MKKILMYRLFSDRLKVFHNYLMRESDGGNRMEQRIMRVTGKGKLRLKPDVTRITMTLEGNIARV